MTEAASNQAPEKKGPGRPKKSSKREMQIPRFEKGQDGRPARDLLSSNRNLWVPKGILDDIRSMNCEVRWVLDNDKGRIGQLQERHWVIYSDAEGQEVTRPSGSTARYLLMVRDKGFAEQARLLQRQQNNASVKPHTTLKAGEYIPDDLPDVLTEDQH